MAQNTRALLQGAADIYITDFGGTEPTTAHFAGPAPTAWNHLGYTAGGTEVSFTKEYSDIMVDQVTLPMHGVVTGESCTISTNLAQSSLAELQVALNGGVLNDQATYQSFDPLDHLAGSQVNTPYKMIVLKGLAPRDGSGVAGVGFVVIRKVLSVEGVKLAWKKDDQTVLEVSFKGFYVDSTKRAWSAFYQKPAN